jgi:hypothetical protein
MSDFALPPRLRCDGARLLNPKGKPVFLRGVNMGAWGEDQPEDCNDFAAWGANVVRIPLRWWGLYGDAKVDSRDNQAAAFISRSHLAHWLDLITAAASHQMWVIPAIDSNCGQSGLQEGTRVYCDPYGSWGSSGRNFFTDPTMRSLFAAVWKAASRRLRGVSHIAMLELLPEPLDGRGEQVAPAVREFYREMIEAVRSGGDTDTPFLIGARNGYDALHVEEAWLEERTDVIYTGNLLNAKVTNPDKREKAIEALVTMRDTRDVPVFVQQVGRSTADDPDLVDMRAVLDELTAQKIGFTWWQNKQNTENPLDKGLHYKDGHGGWIAKPDEIELLTSFLGAS